MSINGIIGKKIGSTSYFLEDGSMIGVTAVTAGPCKVSQIKLEETDGYNAVQLAYEDVSKTTLPLKGHFQKLGDVCIGSTKTPKSVCTGSVRKVFVLGR